MKSKFTLLFMLVFLQMNLYAQKIDHTAELSKLKKHIKEDKPERFRQELENILSVTNESNVSQILILTDHIYNIAKGGYYDACDTLIDVLRKNHLADLLKYLSNREESEFENAYIIFMSGKLKYSIQQNVAISNFESNINKILPSLSAKEKEYALNIKTVIVQKAN